MPLVDLLQLLAMNRRSGVLGVTTEGGAGEVRLAEGDVVDAVFRRLEGEKALFRLLGERRGHFLFVPGEAPTLRRIRAPTPLRLMESMRQVDELARRRNELAPGGDALLIEDAESTESQGSVERDLTALLQIPRAIDELIDEINAPDLTILDALARLTNAGRIRRIPRSELTTPFASPEQLPLLRALVTRLTRPGFMPPPRLGIATTAKRMPALSHAVRHITDAVVATDPARAGLPALLGVVRLGDGVELALVGLPVEEVFAPAWAMALPGMAAVVRLADAESAALDAHCEALEVTLIEAEGLMGTVDVAVPGQIAALVRCALEAAAGG
jgi:hypothetical protein